MPRIDHNYGGPDALAYQTAGGNGVAKAEIKIFRKEDWDGGRRSSRFLIGRIGTDAAGRWNRAIELATGTYVLLIGRPGQFGPDTHEVKVGT